MPIDPKVAKTPGSPDLPPLPPIPSLHNLKVFTLGAIWAMVGGLGLAGALVLDSLLHYQDYTEPIAWDQVRRMAVGGAAGAAVGYWRKYRALLQCPPDTGQNGGGGDGA